MKAVHTARKLPNDGVRNGWYETLPPPAEARRVTSTVTADWAVLGAGACGLAAARRLGVLRPDDTVAVVDAMRVGYGNSGRNAGFMLSHHSHGGIKNLDVARQADRLFGCGYNYLREIVETHQIRCDWSDWGQIYVSASREGDAHLDAVADGFDALAVPQDRMDRDELEAVTGSRFYTGGVHVKGAALVQPAAMMRGLGATLPANVALYEDSPVTELRTNGEFRLICPDGEIVAKQLILTNHVFAEEMGFKRYRVVPLGLFASLTRPLTADERGHIGNGEQFGLLPASPNGSTVRLTVDGRILMRNTFIYARDKQFGADLIANAATNHRASIAKRWPALDGVDLTATWGGIMAMTRNEGRVFGEIAPGLHIVLTTDAAPMTRGTACGKLMAEKLCGIDSEELRFAEMIPDAAILPPDPVLRFVANRRLNKIERTEPAER
jgi:glycine/D-amino acid oxidase-like deaminating enzyme